MPAPIVIAGAGQAGAQAAQSLRQAGFDGEVLLISDEAAAPYQRPPLSKKYLAGELTADRLLLKAASFYAENKIEFRAAARILRIDPQARRLTLAGGGSLAYSKLLLALGASARALPLPGADLPGVHTLRTIADADRIGEGFKPGAKIIIIGGGYIGLEVSAVAAGRGISVTVLEAAPRVMARAVSESVSEFYHAIHRKHGVDLRLNARIGRIAGSASAEGIELDDGAYLPADLVLIAAGAAPVTGIAVEAGIACNDGILVDEFQRTNAPDTFAAGDCARFPSKLYGRSIRLESVQNAIDQAKAAALSMLGSGQPYDPLPWFWSDQYDVKLQIAGLSQGFARTETAGSQAEGKFSVRYLSSSGQLLAVDSINSPRDHMLARREIAAEENRAKSQSASASSL